MAAVKLLQRRQNPVLASNAASMAIGQGEHHWNYINLDSIMVDPGNAQIMSLQCTLSEFSVSLSPISDYLSDMLF